MAAVKPVAMKRPAKASKGARFVAACSAKQGVGIA